MCILLDRPRFNMTFIIVALGISNMSASGLMSVSTHVGEQCYKYEFQSICSGFYLFKCTDSHSWRQRSPSPTAHSWNQELYFCIQGGAQSVRTKAC